MPNKTLILFLVSAAAINAAPAIGKVHRFDENSRRVEVLLAKPAGSYAGKMWIQGRNGQLVPCSVVAFFHTKCVCLAEKTAMIAVAAKVFDRGIAEKSGAKTAASIYAGFNLHETPFFTVKIPKDWNMREQPGAMGINYVFTPPPGPDENHLGFLVGVRNFDGKDRTPCTELGQMEAGIKKDYKNLTWNRESQVEDPTAAHAAGSDDACHAVFEASAQNVPFFQAVTVHKRTSDLRFITMMQFIEKEFMVQYAATMGAMANSLRIKKQQAQ